MKPLKGKQQAIKQDVSEQGERRVGGRECRLRLTDDLLWGVNPVREALEQEAGRISEVFLVKDRHGSKWDDLIALAKEKKVRFSFVDSLKLSGEGAAQVRHQGVVCRMSSVPLLPFEELLDRFTEKVRQGEKPALIVCDSLQDPHNLGAVIRSAYAAGMLGVLTTSENSAPLGGTAAKSSAGAISHIDICQVTNLANALQQLKKAGAWVFGALKEQDSVSLFETDLSMPVCIVVGSEGKGIRPLVRKQCDVLLSIPMVGALDSLNSSVAAAVIMFEALRQRIEPVAKQ